MKIQIKSFIVFLIFPMLLVGGVVLGEDGDTPKLIQEGIGRLVKVYEAEIKERGQYPTAITALTGLAILGGGFSLDRGPYQKELKIITDRLLKAQRKKDGWISLGDQRSMYGHGFATLYLSQVYGMNQDEKVHHALKKACKFIIAQQNDKGGWNYEPDKGDEGSVTIVQVQALRAARDVAIDIPYETIKKAIGYVKKSQYPNGSIAYRPGSSGQGTAALTAAGMAVLFNAGEYDLEEEVKLKGFSYLDNNLSYKIDGANHFLYTHFYAAQVYKQRGSMYFSTYFSRIGETLKPLLQGAVEEGKALDIDKVSPAYSMAMMLLILETSLNYLPIFTD